MRDLESPSVTSPNRARAITVQRPSGHNQFHQLPKPSDRPTVIDVGSDPSQSGVSERRCKRFMSGCWRAAGVDENGVPPADVDPVWCFELACKRDAGGLVGHPGVLLRARV